MTIRELTFADAEAVAHLATELGYPSTSSEASARLAGRTGSADLAAFGAEVDGMVVGWLDVAVRRPLDGEPHGEICGLVVAATYRSLGIGAALVAHAEVWAAGRGASAMVVRSRVAREGAHRFYLREGYSESKRQIVFRKTLGTPQIRGVAE